MKRFIMLGIRRQTPPSRSAHSLAGPLAFEKGGVALEDPCDSALHPELVNADEHPCEHEPRRPREDGYDNDDVDQLQNVSIVRPLA
jgi:hypothetical protein